MIEAVNMRLQRGAAIEDRILQRVCSEVLEMPGSRLTAQQADANFLCRHAHGTYSRLTDGFVDTPRAWRGPLVVRR